MNHLKLYDDYLSEAVMSSDDIYKKHYGDISQNLFLAIMSTDPTRKDNKIGIYTKWLLNLHRKNKFNIEDFYKATEYLTLYHRFKHTLPIEKRNIDNIKDLPALAKIIEPFEEPEPELLTSEENKKAAFVKSFENYDLYIPQTYEQSRDLGRGTKWCTSADSEDGRKYFNQYHSSGILYILMSKSSPTEKYQFHFESMQFMNKYDEGTDLMAFLKNNKDIRVFFKFQIEKVMSFLDFKNYNSTENVFPLNRPYTFYFKNDEVLIEYDKPKKRFYVGEKICKILKKFYLFSDLDIMEYIEKIIKEERKKQNSVFSSLEGIDFSVNIYVNGLEWRWKKIEKMIRNEASKTI